MDTQKRQRVGIIGSIIVHCLVFLLVAFSGVLNVSQAYTDEIVEITMYGGGGGGGDHVELLPDALLDFVGIEGIDACVSE